MNLKYKLKPTDPELKDLMDQLNRAYRNSEIISMVGISRRITKRAKTLYADIPRENKFFPKSGHTNIDFHIGTWRLMLSINGKQTYCGRFDTLEQALSERDRLRRKHGLRPIINRTQELTI